MHEFVQQIFEILFKVVRERKFALSNLGIYFDLISSIVRNLSCPHLVDDAPESPQISEVA